MNKFDRVFWNRLWKLVRPYWVSRERRKGVVLAVTIVVIELAAIALGAYYTYLFRDSTDALVGKHAARFYHLMLVFCVFVAVYVPVQAWEPWLAGRLIIIWREWLTKSFVAMGFAHRAFYQIGLGGKVDNPDQRISVDLNTFVTRTLSYSLILMGAIASAATYFGILWSISRSLAVILFAYAVVGTWLTLVVGRRLITINYDQERYEADYRFGLVHVRDNTEPIFMYGGEEHESRQLQERFDNVVGNFNLLILWQRHLKLVTATYNGLIGLLPYWYLAGFYFAGHLDYGKMVQAALAFGALHSALSLIVNMFPSLAEFASTVNRLGGYIEECDAAREAETGERERIETVEDGRVAFDDLRVLTPDDARALVSGLSVDVSALAPLLIQGPSGIGKTSLLRALAGIWREGRGRIERPRLSEVMFLPQRPYMILGSLREQLTYPRATDATDAQLFGILTEVNLEDLPERFGGLQTEMQWVDVLSPGEQQRLAFARLLLNRPSYAFLDEATSALDPENEAIMYNKLAASGIGYMSSGHRPALLRFHRNVLELRGGADWRLHPSTEFTTPTRAA